MTLSDAARNALRNAVQGMRGKLTSDLEDRLVGTYGIQRDGSFQAISKLPALESAAFTANWGATSTAFACDREICSATRCRVSTSLAIVAR